MLPLYHSGMGDVQPKGSTVPRVGRKLTVTVGEPLDLREVTCRCNAAGEDQRQVRRRFLPQGRVQVGDVTRVDSMGGVADTEFVPNQRAVRVSMAGCLASFHRCHRKELS